MGMKKLIIGNWKMNPATTAEALKLARSIKRVAHQLTKTDVVIAPPLVFVVPAAGAKPTPHFHLAAQTLSVENGTGPHTGEVSATILKGAGIQYVIIGHSEERERGETDAVIAQKVARALDVGIIPVICVGEKVRDESGSHLEGLKQQIKASLKDVSHAHASKMVIAYEPVWAIGASEPMKNEEIFEASLFVKKVCGDLFGPEIGVKTTVLYGGSVNRLNAPDIISIGKVDGLLVGRESINAPGFTALLKAVDVI